VYYGSTTQPLCKRISEHRSAYKRYKNGKGKEYYKSVFIIFDEFGLENCKIELVELFPCENKNQLHQKEGEYIKNNECVNKNIAGRTQKEYNKTYYNEKFTCDICKKEMFRNYKTKHLTTKIHQKALIDQAQEPEEEAAPDST
jgi:hypothetical protein